MNSKKRSAKSLPTDFLGTPVGYEAFDDFGRPGGSPSNNDNSVYEDLCETGGKLVGSSSCACKKPSASLVGSANNLIDPCGCRTGDLVVCDGFGNNCKRLRPVTVDMPKKLFMEVAEAARRAITAAGCRGLLGAARDMKKALDAAYGSSWTVVVGERFAAIGVSHSGTFAHFYLNQVEVVVFKAYQPVVALARLT